MTDIHSHNKSLIGQLRQAMYNYEPQEVLETLKKLFHDDAIVHLCFPFEDLDGAEGLFTEAYKVRRLLQGPSFMCPHVATATDTCLHLIQSKEYFIF